MLAYLILLPHPTAPLGYFFLTGKVVGEGYLNCRFSFSFCFFFSFIFASEKKEKKKIKLFYSLSLSATAFAPRKVSFSLAST